MTGHGNYYGVDGAGGLSCALARQCRLESMDTTRQTVSILQAVSNDIVAVVKVVSWPGRRSRFRPGVSPERYL